MTGPTRSPAAARPSLVVDADSHVVEPPGFLDGWVESHVAGRVPRLVDDDGDDVLELDGRRFFSYGMMHGLVGGAQVLPDAGGRPRWRWQDALRPGAYAQAERLADMDADGVDAAVVYPTVAMGFFSLPDRDLARALARGYNRWIADWVGARPDRLWGASVVVPVTAEQTAADVDECLALDPAAILVPADGDGLGYADPLWEPLFARAAEAGVPVASHAFGGGGEDRAARSDSLVEALVERTAAVERALVTLVFGGVLDRHRGLRFVSVENEAGWAAGLIERADVSYRRGRRSMAGLPGCTRPPGEIFRQQVFCTFIHDRAAIDARRVIGGANLLWSTDYPHNATTWPHSLASLEAQLRADVTPVERAAIAGANAAALHRPRGAGGGAGGGPGGRTEAGTHR